MDHYKLLCVVVLMLFHFAESKYKAYNTTSKIVSGKLNVHLVPHSHDDVGWLKTLDQYYLGSKNTIQTACVQDVLDSIVTTLQIDKNRKFIYVEQAFFQMWWKDQSPAIHEMVKKLVSSGQLELINGGICMHDEATPHYIDMIDQTTLGHRFIKQEFNVTPRIGWQIDPFGHSVVQAYLLGAEVGFDALFFGRIDYQDRARRKDEKTLEVIWQGSKSLGSTAQIFAGAFPENYDPPADLSFEVNENTDHPIIQDNLNLSDYNVHARVDQFVSAAKDQAAITRTNHIMWTMGTDFKYQYAQTWFRQMDKFIHYVNRDGRVNALYSTPSIYTDAKYASKEAWPLKTDDYFPYADSPNSYWTGYFSSRPALKGYIRMMSAYYLAARQLEFLKGRSQAGPTTDALADALAIAQHHDAVSGTSKKHVADDYAKRLSIGYKEASEVVATSLACMVESSPIKSGCGSPTTKFHQCPLLNITYCPPSEVNVSASNSMVVLVYNPLGWKRVDIIRIPVMSDKVMVKDSSGKQIESQLLPLQNAPLALRKHYVEAYLGKSPKTTPKYWLAFLVSVPPLGFNTYTISGTERPASSAMSNVLPLEKTHKSGKNTVDVGHGDLKLVYSTNEGKLISYVNSKTMVKESLTQSYAYYSAYGGYDQASGAYVFRPNASRANTIKPEDKPTILQGPLVAEVHEKINSWIYQITRVYKGKEHAEVEFIVGPVPTDDYVGKEAVTQITTDMKNNKTFYTDSNGRDFLERIRDHRKGWDLQVNEPVAGNYYPINLGMYMKDESKEFSILVDRSVGGSSIRDGQLELMLHRRLLNDDGKGVNEALDESVCIHDKCTGLTIVGRYYFRIDPLGKGAKWRRTFGQEIYSPLLLAFTEQDGYGWFNSHVPSSSMLDSSYVIPENVVIITLQELHDQTVLLRLAHLYEVGEDADLSDMASVHLHKLFAHRKISKIAEMSLSANQERTEMERKRLVWQVKGSTGGDGKVVRGKAVDRKTLVVELGPMEIRTFLINFAHKKSIPK